jgi:hypothetical protein
MEEVVKKEGTCAGRAGARITGVDVAEVSKVGLHALWCVCVCVCMRVCVCMMHACMYVSMYTGTQVDGREHRPAQCAHFCKHPGGGRYIVPKLSPGVGIVSASYAKPLLPPNFSVTSTIIAGMRLPRWMLRAGEAVLFANGLSTPGRGRAVGVVGQGGRGAPREHGGRVGVQHGRPEAVGRRGVKWHSLALGHERGRCCSRIGARINALHRRITTCRRLGASRAATARAPLGGISTPRRRAPEPSRRRPRGRGRRYAGPFCRAAAAHSGAVALARPLVVRDEKRRRPVDLAAPTAHLACGSARARRCSGRPP